MTTTKNISQELKNLIRTSLFFLMLSTCTSCIYEYKIEKTQSLPVLEEDLAVAKVKFRDVDWSSINPFPTARYLNQKLFGPVKSLKEIPFNATYKNGQIIEGDTVEMWARNRHYFYNRLGNNLKELTYNTTGIGYYKYEYEYDKNLMKSYYTIGNSGGYLTRVTMFDEYGNDIISCSMNSDSTISMCSINQFDLTKNLKTQTTYYDKDGTVSRIVIFIYNDRGDLVERRVSHKKEINRNQHPIDLNCRYEYKFNENRNKIKEKMYRQKLGDTTFHLEVVKEFKIDANNNKIKEIEELFYSDGMLKSKKEFDKFGNLLEHFDVNRTGTKRKGDKNFTYTIEEKKLIYEYEYDHYDNWIKQTNLQVNKGSGIVVKSIVHRNIEYWN